MKITDRFIHRLAVQFAKQSARHHGTSVYLPDIITELRRLTLAVNALHESFRAVYGQPSEPTPPDGNSEPFDAETITRWRKGLVEMLKVSEA